MDVTITQENPIMIKAEVNVPWEQVAPHQQKALKVISQNVQIPGFRKGKAPAALLKKRFKNEILHEITQHLLPETIQQWTTEKNIKLVTSPRLVDIDLVDKQHLHYKAEVDVKPEIELKEWKDLEAETLMINITPEKVEEDLKQQIQAASEIQEITDRPAQEGDTIEFALTAIDADKDETLDDLEGETLTLGADDAHPELSAALSGADSGDDIEYSFKASEEDSFENWRGKNIKAYLEILKITQTSTPELNDEFAKSKEFDDLEALKKATEERLRETENDNEKNRIRGALVQKLVEPYDFEVPREWVHQEAKNMVESQMMPYLQAMGGQMNQEQEYMINEMIKYTLPQALFKTRSDVVLEKLAAELDLGASDEEIDGELEAYRQYADGKTVEELRKTMTDAGNLDTLVDGIRRRKAIDAVVEAAKLTEVEKLTEPEKPEAEQTEETQADGEPKTLEVEAIETEAKPATNEAEATETGTEPASGDTETTETETEESTTKDS